MKRSSFKEMDCSIAQTLEVVGEWWTPLILRDAFMGVTRFDDFQRSLGIARNILTSRLKLLVEHGILVRDRYQDHPGRFEYRLTDKGRDLYPIIVSLMRWGDTHTAVPQGPHQVIVHDDCGHAAKPVVVCSHCGQELNAGNSHAEFFAGPVPEFLPAPE